MENSKFKSLILLLLLGFIWGTGYSLARFATTNGVSALGYSFWQSIGPAIMIGFLVLFKKLSSAPPHFKINKERNFPIRYYLICGLTGIVIPNTNMYLAAPHLPAGLLAVIVNTVPIFSYVMALSAKIESFSHLRFFGIACALTGLMLIVLPQTNLSSAGMNVWVLTTLLTPLSFAFCAVYISRYRPTNSESLTLAAGTLFASSILLLPLVLISKNFYLLHWPLTLSDFVILLEIILSSIGYILLFQLIKIAGPVYYSLVDTIVAITGLFWGYVVFHEKLNEWTSLAVLFILAALFLVTKRQRAVVEYPSSSY